MTTALVVVAVVFAVVAGANDGSSILAGSLQASAIRPLTAWLVLVTAVAVAPMVFGAKVATILARGLVAFGSPGSQVAVVIAIISAMAVVVTLTRKGVATSLTLALVGAITGAGLGYGLPVDLGRLSSVLALGLLAPLASALLAFSLCRAVLPSIHYSEVGRTLRRAHGFTLVTQCLAYGANGGQKALAVLVVATGVSARGRVALPRGEIALVALPFGLGVLLGLRRVSTKLGRGILAVRLRHTVVAEAVSTALTLSAGLAGVPLTMSQSIAGALVGAGASEAVRKVRWAVARQILIAWIVTVPASMALAGIAAGIVGRS